MAFFAALVFAVPAYAQRQDSTAYLVYFASAGQTLEEIAALPFHYGDALDWPLLYYLNSEELAHLSTGGVHPASTPLKGGEWLAVLTHDEAKNRLASQNADPASAWVLHLFETPEKEKAYEAAAKIIRAGHFAYLVRQEKDGQILFRVSTGFFPERSHAWQAQEEMEKIAGTSGAWIAQPDREEFFLYAGHENRPTGL
ncbi:MAG: hypothetical protein QMD09_00250 [Desulfatibacillaceae bacterium]|nr:hypothetical protein [Desulfatibacillaceae bacterium]